MNPSERFADRGAAYAHARPSYPAAAIDLLFADFPDPRNLKIADLGAGTGIASRLLAARGAEVYAVEASEDMRKSADCAERVTYVAARAEATGLAEHSVDLVTAFQAYHWFDPQQALTEMLRVLKPDGRAALIFNLRDERDAPTAVFADLLRAHTIAAVQTSGEIGREYFKSHAAWKSVRTFEIPGEHVLDQTALHMLCASISYLAKQGSAYDKLTDDLERYFSEFVLDGYIRLHMLTNVTIADRVVRHRAY